MRIFCACLLLIACHSALPRAAANQPAKPSQQPSQQQMMQMLDNFEKAPPSPQRYGSRPARQVAPVHRLPPARPMPDLRARSNASLQRMQQRYQARGQSGMAQPGAAGGAPALMQLLQQGMQSQGGEGAGDQQQFMQMLQKMQAMRAGASQGTTPVGRGQGFPAAGQQQFVPPAQQTFGLQGQQFAHPMQQQFASPAQQQPRPAPHQASQPVQPKQMFNGNPGRGSMGSFKPAGLGPAPGGSSKPAPAANASNPSLQDFERMMEAQYGR